MPVQFGLNSNVAGGSALYLPRNGPAYETRAPAPTLFNGSTPKTGGMFRPQQMLPQMPQQAEPQAPQQASQPAASAPAQPMLPQSPQASAPMPFGMRQNLTRMAGQNAYLGSMPSGPEKLGTTATLPNGKVVQQYADSQYDRGARQTAQAARNTTRSDIVAAPYLGAGYFTNQNLVASADARANSTTAANNQLTNSGAALNTANADTTRGMLPTMQQQGQANAGYTQAQTQQITQMLPGQVTAQGLQNKQQEQLMPSVTQIGQNQAQAGQIANQAAGAAAPYAGPMAQAQVNATNATAGFTKSEFDRMTKENADLRRELSRYQNTAAGQNVGGFGPAGASTPPQPAAPQQAAPQQSAPQPAPQQPAAMRPPSFNPAGDAVANVGSVVSSAAAPPSDADIQYTAQKYGMTPEQVRAKLGM